MQLQLI